MNLLSCIVAHNRLELTKRCVESYLATVTVPHVLVVVDNASSDETAAWLAPNEAHRCPHLGEQVFALINDENLYPGAACNLGWLVGLNLWHALPDANVLHRSDNDVEYLPGWCKELERCFVEMGNVGQVGLLEHRYEEGCSNVGGNSAILRKLWDAGARWDEVPWGGRPGAPALNEDALMSAEIRRRGYRVARVGRETIVHHGWDWDAYPDYYAQTCIDRGYDPADIRAHFDRMRTL